MKLLDKITNKQFIVTQTPDNVYGLKRGSFAIPNVTDDKYQIERIVDLLNGLNVKDNSRVFELAVRCLEPVQTGHYSVTKTKETYGITYDSTTIHDLTTNKEHAKQLVKLLNGVVTKDYDTLLEVIKALIEHNNLV